MGTKIDIMFVKNITRGELVIGAPAKVNLFLEVLNRRNDGYHNIYSLFQAVSLFDRLTVRRTEAGDVLLSVFGPEDLPVEEDNLIIRAFHLMRKRFDLPGSIEVQLDKNIPVAAGLGGGSADGAATIKACNELFELGLTSPEMAELSLELGSDCPFFFSSGQVLISGRGEIITGTTLDFSYWLVLVTPDFGLSTPEAYASLKRGLTATPKRFSLKSLRTLDDFLEALRQSANDFEGTCFDAYPELSEIRNSLLDAGARLARMSGSGPTIFGIFEDLPDLSREDLSKREHWRVNTVKPINLPFSKL